MSTRSSNRPVGSDADPIVLNLTDGTTEPPAPNAPISGKIGTIEESPFAAKYAKPPKVKKEKRK